ncbi:alpha/beta fold hydrolase [Kribbella sp. GL6]|uniref:alpha/beta fold hydrolase n=1 Tax=Kribbella sp. GL6 TaxID=3419765 RepID=UPI003D008C56
MLTWGSGEHLVLLIHGMLGAATQYHELGPALAGYGYRVVAVDLPGHGAAAPGETMEDFVAAVVEAADRRPALAIGHSLGAIVLWEALAELRPERAVYVDVPLDGGGPSRRSADELRAHFARSRAARNEGQLRGSRPGWSAEDCRVEARAAEQFDVETAVALERSYAGRPALRTSVPSLVVRADPSRYVSAERARELEALGFCVRGIDGAGHSVWYGRVDDFLRALDGWL